MMDPRGARAFVGRDWASVSEAKSRYWRERKLHLGAGEGLRAADELRRQVLARFPTWPSEEDRDSDLETHRRVADALRRASPTSRG